MNNILLDYLEFGSDNAPSIKDYFEKNPYKGQKAIAEYLRRGHAKLSAPGCSYAVISGAMISASLDILTDGEYSWDSSLAYYVDKYNMRLPEEFEEKVLGI